MPKIIELWAFVAEDSAPDDEGIMAMQMPGTEIMMPFVCADKKRMEELKPYAEYIKQLTGKPYKIKRFELIE